MFHRRRSKRKAGLLRRLGLNNNGNATILAAFATPMIIGGGGLAIDFAQIYVWERELQFATDQAALAAAYELSMKPGSTIFKDRALREFAVNEQVTTLFNTTPTVTRANYSDGVGNSVIVTASASKTLPFSSFFTNSATIVRVSSQAAFSSGATFNGCLIAVNETEDATVIIGGDAVFTAGCGIAALSTSDTAVVINGQPQVEAGFVISAGGIDDWLDTHGENEIHEYVEGLSDPFKDLSPPNDPTPQGEVKDKCQTYGKGQNKVVKATAQPGTYTDFKVFCSTVMQEGVYVIDGGDVEIPSQYDVTSSGGGVIFVLKNGAGLKINGGSNIRLAGISSSVLTSKYGYSQAAADKLDGMLVFEDRDSEGNLTNMINGDNNTFLDGKVYLPVSPISFAGTAQVSFRCLLLVANKVELTGTTDMRDFCPANDELDDTVGYVAGGVALVN